MIRTPIVITPYRAPKPPPKPPEPEAPEGPGLFAQMHQQVDAYRMKRDLSKWFAASTHFKANGLAAGEAPYQQLYEQSCTRIRAHAERWGVPPEKLLIELPALYSLQKLAHPPVTAKAHPAAMSAGLVAALFAVTALLGACDGVFHLVAGWIAR
jgi:hypothetical protein